MTKSKSSSTTINVILALLALWSIISLIIIVVWATSPDMKGASQCNAERKTLEQKYNEEKSVWGKDRLALEELVRQGWNNKSLLLSHIDLLKNQTQVLNQSLESCTEENALLSSNITVLESEIELHKATEANLTAENLQKQEMIELLELNLTQTISEWHSCNSLHQAAQMLQTAAEKQRDGCQSGKLNLQKQLEKCKKTEQAQQHNEVFIPPQADSPNDGPVGPRSGFTLVIMVCISLLLIP
ncbi:uncharacterized protein si:ch211-1a19.3 [Trichomycterus rosablanca]|uniref:uncharacterized protein si:ch211-1a19.3 n=1 Tax=Trichomycterus rosablanca TaxID=2290929 RepID=UPI002F35859E